MSEPVWDKLLINASIATKGSPLTVRLRKGPLQWPVAVSSGSAQ